MKTKILIILSFGFFAFILSSWTLLSQAPKKNIINEICQTRDAELIQAIGKIAIIYRKNED